MGRRVDCSVSNEAKNEIKEESPSGLSLGGDGGNLGGEGGGEMGPSLGCKENKGATKDTDSHMGEKVNKEE